MTRMISVVGVIGLLGAGYMAVFQRPESRFSEGDVASNYNVLFAIAIAIISMLLIATARTDDLHRE